MSRVAIFTDSASDMDPDMAAAEGIRVVPLLVSFGSDTYKAGVEMSTADFWERMVAPDAPFPKTAASSPGEFKDAYEAAFTAGAEAIVAIHVVGTLSGTIKSAQIARDMLPDREIHVVDSLGASMAEGILAMLGVDLAAEGRSAAEIAEVLEARATDMRTYVAVETLEYLQERRPDQRRAGGDRDAPVGQADHPGQCRGRRHRRPGQDPQQGARAAHRADLRAAHRAARHPPHDQPGRGGVPRRGHRPRPRWTRHQGRLDQPGRGVRRAAPRPGLRRCGDPVPGLTLGLPVPRQPRPSPPDQACQVPERSSLLPVGPRQRKLRQGCDNLADRYHRGDAKGRRAAILWRQMSRAPAIDPVRRDPAARPVGSSGRRPEPTAVSLTARHVRASVP